MLNTHPKGEGSASASARAHSWEVHFFASTVLADASMPKTTYLQHDIIPYTGLVHCAGVRKK